MPEIPLRDARGNVIARSQVDPHDFARFGHLRWHIHQSDTKRYAVRKSRAGGQQHHVFLHRSILGLERQPGVYVDHINGDSLDNRRENLRVVTAAQNAQNQTSRGGSSRYRGVSWDRSRAKWIATVMIDGSRTTIGRFATEDEAGAAAAAYRREHMPFSEEAA